MLCKQRVLLIILLVLLSAVLFYLRTNSTKYAFHTRPTTNASPIMTRFRMVVSVVVCGNRTEETLVMIKSVLILTHDYVEFYIFTDESAHTVIYNKLLEWQAISHKNFSFNLLLVQFPTGAHELEFRKLFKPCASQRLFLPDILKNVDAILYVDTDTLFLGPVNQIWRHFLLMNETQAAALAPEHEDFQTGWYNRFAQHPFYKPLGVNTGVMLMNLTKLRTFGWKEYIVPIYEQYKTKIPWGDQDIINILFSYHPERLYIYGCNYNFRADHCMYTSVCKAAENEGIVVLHGSRGIFHNNKHPAFRSVYKAVEDYQWSKKPYDGLLLPLKSYLDSSPSSQCGAIKTAFTKNLEKHIEKQIITR